MMIRNRIPKYRRGFTSTGVLVAAGAAMVMLGAAWLTTDGAGSSTDALEQSDLYLVEVGSFDITIPASGELAALEQVEVRCELDGNNNALVEIVDEGINVKEGDLLFRTDNAGILEKIQNAKDNVVNAENTLRNREASLEISEGYRKSELQKAQVKVDQAELALKSWEEGEVLREREKLDLSVLTAEREYKRLKEKHEKSKELFEKEFLSKDELDSESIDLLRKESALKTANTNQGIYEKYTYFKEKLQKESDSNQAVAEMGRTDKRTAAELRSAQDNVKASNATLDSKIEWLEKYELQLTQTEVFAPSDGMVVFGSTINRRGRGDNEKPLQVGSKLYRNQLVVVLPNIERMAADVKVNEALSGLIESGQSALIKTDAIPDVVITGTVLGVSVLAEDGGWRDPNRRDYGVKVELDENHGLALKPSMRVKVDIFVDKVVDALFVPIQAIHRRGRDVFVYLRDGDEYIEQIVDIKRNSELFVEVVEGLDAGNQVLLIDPPAGTVIRPIDGATEK